ncbi:two-component sensor histidine kinase [Alicyclobacillus curvatus]|nr:two-component sensor histidine kinase [Alicyclobacillus curvatus]
MVPHKVGRGPTHPFPSLNWLNAGVIHLDNQGWLTIYNDLAAQLLDIAAEPDVPVRIEECIAATREEYKLLHHILTSKAEVRNQLITWAENRRIRHVLIDSYSVETGVYVVMKDLGDFVLLDQHLQRTDKLAVVGKVAAGVAHEIRNPLTTVRGFLQVMMNRLSEKEMDEEEEYLRMMVAEVDKVESLVKELLLLSKPQRTARRHCQLSQVVSALEPFILEQAAEKKLRAQVTLDEDTPAVVGDEELLSHVIVQLVENAVEAMDVGGRLTVSVRRENRLVRLDVGDTGPGIPYYQMDQVFDAFFTTKEKGTGLGLPICQKIVSDHGGEIHVSSKGFGTTFSVLLPAAECALT